MTFSRDCEACNIIIINPGRQQRFCIKCIKERQAKAARMTSIKLVMRIRSEKSLEEENEELKKKVRDLNKLLKTFVDNPIATALTIKNEVIV